MRPLPVLVFAAILNSALPFASLADRRPSEEALIFRRLRGGVCTVYGDNGQGSGFLVDSLGVILTNDHVVGRSLRLRVKFDDSTRVGAVLLAADDKKDIAVIRVHPSVVSGYPVLRIAQDSDSMVFEGERVIAIGSPLNQEKIMTTGIVSKVEAGAIISDVNINHGNSGGPLLNLDGEVIAVNTFGDFTSQGGPGISGCVKISEAGRVLARAMSTIDSAGPPSPRRLPLPSSIPFPLDSLRAAAETEKFPRLSYEISGTTLTGKFNVVVVTPVYDAWRTWRGTVRLAKSTKKREQKGGASTGQSYDAVRDMRSWMQYTSNDYAPVVTIQMAPKIGQTAGSIFGNILGAAAAGFAGTGYHGSYRYEYKADFLKVEVLRDSALVDDLNVFRAMIPAVYATADWGGSYSIEDQARTGIFQCEPSVFAPNPRSLADSVAAPTQSTSRRKAAREEELFPRIQFRVWSVEKPNDPYEFTLPRSTVKRVWDDFAAWRAVANQAAK